MEEDIEKIQEETKRWNKDCLGKHTFRKCETDWGLEIKPLYTVDDTKDINYLEDIGFPGEYPFTRAPHPSMYLGKLWTMRQYSGYGTADETNKRYKYLLQQGQTGLSVAFDLPTQIGYDSDHSLSQGEVGKVGVAVDSLADMETIFNGLPLDKLSTSMTINAPAAILLAMYLAVAEKQGIGTEKLNGTIQNDILKEYTVRGTYIFPVGPSLRLITDIFEYCSKHVPKWNTINIAGYHMREAGATAVQEIAFTFADAIEYVNAGIKAGLRVDDFAPRISWIFNTHNNFFEEIAKYRAARRLWAKIMKKRFGASDPRSWMFRFHTQTAGSALTAQQPLNNVVRVAFQTLAAVLGGAQSLASCSFDEALALPTEESVRLSLRTQQIIAHEIGVTDTVDPMGGSFYIESLTKKMEEKITDYIKRIDELGGAAAAIEKGYIQQEIQESAYRYQKEVESGKKVVVGMNSYQVEEPLPKGLLKVDTEVGAIQIKKLKELKTARDNQKVQSALLALRKTAEGYANLMPPIIEAVKAYATLGEICDVLREVFGEYEGTSVI
ncbi:MAG: methylmalonyl-CoA mutase [Deltaproteobacteria bacterium CG_4_9_14_3_um_filter_44_9]|nr:MAG: methylmalonyl-CoA mutase [Deltaproteobacteria bacterium CG06_land_8_20_14_3_00_44_19]PIX23892.1 MAG: methylmalonyl-CoA mutase [Deltaproteobacteria bacterium CG_4_8_14_3_um_filter_43_13]PIZ18337.1 MAG: methylmalonyl-CoA mutase [Deltaproteobacteria bacterium CG_4_10_14_0_8_um_filter_43_12]PJB41039.1 MAG: methylmalonyl-CoA mutase [Deltaproteobacteria bacterium CG_4_9_14_3_um_filter_44_9]HCX90383.1 methylmalonyl-CoA mutase [Deltaproteobacteria bacterium]